MFPRFNHWIARQEGQVGFLQNVRHKAIIPAVPWVGGALAVGQLAYDVAHAPDADTKRKVVVRDTLSAIGAFFGVWLGVKAVKDRPNPGQVVKGLKGWGWADRIVNGFNSIGLKLSTEACHHSISEPFLGHSQRSPLNRVKALFQSSLHSHMGKALVELGLLSAIPIFLGGIPFGAVADAINGEDVKKTLPHKLKEGIFQWVGNVMFCTVAIYGLTKGAHGLTQQLWKRLPKLRQQLVKSSEKALAKAEARLAKSTPTKPAIAAIPSPLTGSLSYFVRQCRNKPDELFDTKLFNHFFKDRGHGDHMHPSLFGPDAFAAVQPQWQALKQDVTAMMAAKQPDKAIVARLQHFFTTLYQKDFAAARTPEGLLDIAKTRLEAMGDGVGAVLGVLAGIFGGAVLSNGINRAISNGLNLPHQHTANGLFQTGTDASGNDTSFMAGKLGDRGLRVADGLMHLDDLPTVLYMAGMHIIEAFIHVLYGIGGFLAGTAGTVYTQPAPPKPPKDLPRAATVATHPVAMTANMPQPLLNPWQPPLLAPLPSAPMVRQQP